MKKIYLAGGFCNWRDKVANIIDNCIWLDPRNAQDPLTGKNFQNWFEMEVEMLKECDAVIAYISFKNLSGYGSTWEMGVAYALNKPYILINEKDNEYQWGMQTKGSFANFKNLNEAFQWIKKTKWMGLSVANYKHYESGVPCKHIACWAHKSHPCEYCGRIGCEGEAFLKSKEKIKYEI